MSRSVCNFAGTRLSIGFCFSLDGMSPHRKEGGRVI